MNSKTLTLKKPANSVQAAQKKRPEHSLAGRDVVIQTKSPNRITGRISSFDGGWIVIDGTEQRWLADGSLSGPITSGEFSIDRSNVTYFLEVM